MSHWIRIGGVAVVTALVVFGGYLMNLRADKVQRALPAAPQERTQNPQVPHSQIQDPQDIWAEKDATEAFLNNVDPTLVELFRPPNFAGRVLEELPPDSGTWESTYAALRTRAEAGDADARYRLYRAAQACYHGPRTASELQARQEAIRAPYKDGGGVFRDGQPDADVRARELEANYQFCRDSHLDETERYMDWLVAAADAGHLRAQLAYGKDFPGDKLNANDAADAEILKSRHDQYITYLESAKAAGSIDAVARLASVHYAAAVETSPNPSSDDLKQAFANLYAYAWYRLRYENSAQSFRYLKDIGARLSAHEYQEALETGREILRSDQCCVKVPEIR